jgi:hypothetical protein
MDEQTKKTVGRRGFLARAGLATAAAVAAPAVANANPAELHPSTDRTTGPRYKESDHIRKFYATNAR